MFVALDVLPQFLGRLLDILIAQVIDDSLVACRAGFPFSHLDTVAKSPEEDLQQIAKRDERCESAGLDQCPVKLDVEVDPGLQLSRRPEPIDDFLERRIKRFVLAHPPRDVR